MRYFRLFLLWLSFFVHSTVNASGAVAGATEMTQLMNNVQLVASHVELVSQTATQIQQYQAMLRNLVQMTPSQLLDQAAQKLWVDKRMAKTFNDLRRIVIAGQKTSYTLANIDHQFRNLHPGYSGAAGNLDFQRAYRDWSDNTLDSVKNSLALISAHADDFATEGGLMAELANKSQTAQGQLQALQAGNAVGLQMVGQLQKLRQLQMAQMQSQNSFVAGQQSENDAKKANLQKVFGNLPGTRIKRDTQK